MKIRVHFIYAIFIILFALCVDVGSQTVGDSIESSGRGKVKFTAANGYRQSREVFRPESVLLQKRYPLLTSRNFVVNDSGSSSDTNVSDGECSDSRGRCSLKAAIDQLNPIGSGKISFALSDSTVIEVADGPLMIWAEGEISIAGPGSGLLTVRGGKDASQLGIFAFSGKGKTKISGLTIENGTSAFEGGCVFVELGAHLDIENTVIQNCGANFGGGISSRGSVRIDRSSIMNNSAGLGGGIFIGEEGEGSIFNSTISGNIASQGCGINHNSDITVLKIVNSTISGNECRDGQYVAWGGGIHNYGPLDLTNVTLVDNTSTYLAGGVADFASVWGISLSRVRNTIVAKNLVPVWPNTNWIPDVYTYGIVSLGNNIVGIGPVVGMKDGIDDDHVGAEGAPINPLIEPLANNGGPTKTRALETNSPARDAGNNCVVQDQASGGCLESPLVYDQRGPGFKRNIAAVDIGAFEISTSPAKAAFDYDGDGKTDVSIFRHSNATWYVGRSGLGDMYVQAWGVNGDVIVPADYDGDGKTDLAVRRASDDNFYVFNSSNSTIEVRNFGIAGDIAVPSDYNGDGKSDVAVWRPSNGTWYLSLSGSGIFYVMPWGLNSDKPAPGDFDGDGKTELVVFRPSDGKWYTFSTITGTISVTEWGVNGDRPVQGDYNGDGRTDFAVYRPANNTWYRQNSNDGAVVTTPWGLPNDFPVPGDYDGDGKIDVAVWRSSDATWYVNRSSSGVFTQSFGSLGDTPTPSAFVR